MKKLIALLLVIVSLGAVLCSCTTNNSDKISGETTSAIPIYTPTFTGEFDFEGVEIKFIVGEADSSYPLSQLSISAEEDSGNIISSAVYKRNLTFQQRYNCKISLVEVVENGMKNVAAPSLMAGADDYDILGARQRDDIDLCLEGYCLDLNTLSDYGADFIEIDQPWWGTEYIDNMMCNGKLYWLTGVLSLRYISSTKCIAVNSRLYEQHLLDKYGEIFDIVKSGRWTLDLLCEMASQVSNNNNTNMEVWGLKVNTLDDTLDAFARGYGVRYSHENADGTISFDLTDANDDYIAFMNKMLGVSQQDYSLFVTSDSMETPRFENGEILFESTSFQYAHRNLREMNDRFVVVPLPKKDTASDYVTTVEDSNLLFGISYCTPLVCESAVVLEGLASSSYRSTMPIYYDEALRYTYTRNEDVAEMTDIIRNSITTDLAYAFAGYIGFTSFTSQNFSKDILQSLKGHQDSWIQRFNGIIDAPE